MRTQTLFTRQLLYAGAVAFFLPVLLHGCGRQQPVSPAGPIVICGNAGGGYPAVPNARRFGIFSDRLFDNYASELDSLVALLGAVPGFILWYQQIDDPFPNAVVAINRNRGIKTVISLNLESLSLDSAQNDTLLREIARGTWDPALSAFAQNAADAGGPVYLRFGYEMNGTWFPWGGKPDDFIAAWIRAHSAFKQLHAENVQWIFCPGVVWGDQTVANNILPYYPGDSVVDIVGIDGYNYGDNYDRYHSWESFNDVFGPTLPGVYAIGKPLWICEIGCAAGPMRPLWLEQMTAFMDNNPCVGALLWFDTHTAGEPDFRLEADNASLDTMRQWLAR